MTFGTKTDWNLYGTCPRDGATTGQPCTTRRMVNRVMVDDPIRIAHVDRPLLPVKHLTADEMTDTGVVVGLLDAMTPAGRTRVLRYLAERYGFDPRESET